MGRGVITPPDEHKHTHRHTYAHTLQDTLAKSCKLLFYNYVCCFFTEYWFAKVCPVHRRPQAPAVLLLKEGSNEINILFDSIFMCFYFGEREATLACNISSVILHLLKKKPCKVVEKMLTSTVCLEWKHCKSFGKLLFCKSWTCRKRGCWRWFYAGTEDETVTAVSLSIQLLFVIMSLHY